jgi:hypothetical protein
VAQKAQRLKYKGMALKNNKNTNKRKLQRKQKNYHAIKNLATQIKKSERKQKMSQRK